jgi:hypothetical protein
MDYCGFVTPLNELAHGFAVGTGGQELLHGRFTGPQGDGPEGVLLFPKHLRREIVFGAGRLPRRAEGVPRN